MSNTRNIKHQRRAQLDRLLGELKGKLPELPKRGWIAEVRTLLMMTTKQLARRIGVAQAVASNFEKSEREKRITLQSLEKVAEALECDLHYFFIPKKGLEAELYERAECLYKEREKQLEHNMQLEGQGDSPQLKAAWEAYEILKLYNKVWEKK